MPQGKAATPPAMKGLQPLPLDRAPEARHAIGLDADRGDHHDLYGLHAIGDVMQDERSGESGEREADCAGEERGTEDNERDHEPSREVPSGNEPSAPVGLHPNCRVDGERDRDEAKRRQAESAQVV